MTRKIDVEVTGICMPPGGRRFVTCFFSQEKFSRRITLDKASIMPQNTCEFSLPIHIGVAFAIDMG
jgi:hypothetical protein